MNLLAAMALLVMAGDETAAFWSLTTIIQRVIPGYHSEGLELLRLDIRVVASMLEQRDPALLMHLTTLGVFDVVVTKWCAPLIWPRVAPAHVLPTASVCATMCRCVCYHVPMCVLPCADVCAAMCFANGMCIYNPQHL